jgi:hypothetical protein
MSAHALRSSVLFGLDELHDVRMPDLERLHDRRAARLAAALDRAACGVLHRMNETGPDGWPPPESFSFEERSVDQSAPTPEPNLNSRALSPMSCQMSSIESSTEMMKHADAWGARTGQPLRSLPSP